MNNDLTQQIVSNAVGTFFSIAQTLGLAAFFAVFKTVFDVRAARKDLNAAFGAIRRQGAEIELLKKALDAHGVKREHLPPAGVGGR